jgi:2-oxo-4-hydroxy-4-carboxy--5-ureidoimidazoline (OHCU) decarboxylase
MKGKGLDFHHAEKFSDAPAWTCAAAAAWRLELIRATFERRLADDADPERRTAALKQIERVARLRRSQERLS